MKITRAQKDAVISLLKEKISERQKIANDAFYEEHCKEIQKEADQYLKFCKRMENLANQLNDVLHDYNEFIDNCKFLFKDKNDYFTICGITRKGNPYFYDNDCKKAIEQNLKSKVKYPEVNKLDFYKVSRQLELDTLDKDFNLENFINKYLED